jgi:hypothetical protein
MTGGVLARGAPAAAPSDAMGPSDTHRADVMVVLVSASFAIASHCDESASMTASVSTGIIPDLVKPIV